MPKYLVSLWLLFAVGTSAAAREVKTYALDDCFSEATTTASQACRVKVKAAYQTAQFAKARQHLPNSICDFGANISTPGLIEALRPDLRATAALVPNMPIAVLAVGVVTNPLTCPVGKEARVDGLNAGQVVNLCKLPEPDGGMDVCLAYIGALRDAFIALSDEGGDRSFCMPDHERLSDKDAAHMFLEQIKHDPKAEASKPAAEVMAEALAGQYRCR